MPADSGAARIAVIGAGPMGLAVAYELSRQGLQPVVLEADDRPGGMAACFDFAGIEIERYYHFHCLSDRDFFAILEELKLTRHLNWRQTRMGFFYNGHLYAWGSVGAVLAFPALPLLSRIRYLCHAARCLTIRNWQKLDGTTATTWLRQWLGERAYKILWHNLFAYKFYQYTDSISAAWIWSRVRRLGQSRQKLKETLGFLEGGSQRLIDSMVEAIERTGGRIRLSTPVLALRPNPQGGAILTTNAGEECFEQVISTIPLPLLAPILKAGGVAPDLSERYASQPSVACACVVLQTRKPVSRNFWTNVNDERFAIPGVIEMSNLRPFPVAISYVPFYIPADHADYQRSDQAFIDDAWACLKAIQPELNDHDLLASHCSRYRFAQPVCGVHCQQNLPPQNPFKGVITADTTAYYPEDRGISESIGFGRALARNVASLVRGHRE